MPLNDEYLPQAQNVELPKYIQDVLAGAQRAPVSPVGSRSEVPTQTPPPALDPYIQRLLAPQETDMEYDEESGLILPSVKRGAAMTFASLANLVGADETAAEAMEYASQFKRQIEDIQDVKSLADLGTFAVESAAENVASLLAIGAGAVIGTVGLPAAGVMGVSGAVIGGGLANFALQAGESKMAVEAAGGDANLMNVGVPASINTALDTFSILKIAKKAGVLSKVLGKLDEAAEVSGIAGRIKHGVRTGTQAFALEGSTEVIQSYNNMVAAKLATDKEIREAFALQGTDIDELINAFAAGALGAAVTTAPLATAFGGTSKSREALSVDSESASEGTNAAPIQPTETDSNPVPGQDPKQVATPTDKPDDVPPAPETQFTQKEGDATQDAVTPDEDTTIADMQAEIQQRIDFLERGEVEGFVAPDVQEFPLTRVDRISSADTFNGKQPLPARFWDISTGNRVGGISTVFNAITADPSDTVMTNDFRSEFSLEDQQAMTDFVEVLRKEFIPNTTVVFGGSQQFFKTDNNTMAAVASVNIEGRMAHLIQVNDAGIQNISNIVKTDKKALLMETIAHEFGHAVSADKLRSERPKTKSAVYREYSNWLEKQANNTFEEFIKDRFPATSGKYYLTQVPKEVLAMPLKKAARLIGWNNKDLKYHLSFEEYAADNMAKYVGKNADLQNQISKETKGYWAKAVDVFREIWKTLHNFLPQAKFKAWVENIRQQNALNLLMKVPLASESIHAELSEFVDLDINKLRSNLNYNMSEGVRTIETAGTILNDARQIEALRRNYRVSTGFTKKWAGRFLTPSQIAERYGIPQARAYMDRVYDYYQTKMKGISEADGITKQWMDLPQEQADNFGKFVFAISEKSDEVRRRLTPTEVAELRERYDIDDTMFSLYNEMDGSFRTILERLERSILKDIARSYTNNPEAFVEEYTQAENTVDKVMVITSYGVEDYAGFLSQLTKAQKQFIALRNKNYFPRMRFGDYTIVVKRKSVDDKGKAHETTEEFLTFESKKERDAMLSQYLKDYANAIQNDEVDVIGSKLDDTTRSLYGMPQLVVDRIANTLRDTEGASLTADQERAIADISLDLSPGKRYLRHMQRRKNTKGFSTEAMRTYAAYMANASNHLARVEHTQDMTAALRDLRQAQKGQAGDVTDLAELDSYYTEHFRYLLNPENDWAKLRAFGFLWYLGANPKSALINTTQLPMVTYPFLASRYGDKAAVTQLGKAIKDVSAHFVAKKKYTEAEQRLMDKLLQEGVIDESMASDLAGISEGTALQRILPTNKAHRVMNNINYYGGYLFSVAEKYNRQVTALATFRLYMKQSENFDAAYKAAKDAIHKSQFEYAKYNRPEFMRGKKSAFFLFYNYTQQFMYMAFAGGGTKADKGTAIRMWGMLLLLAGIQGLPFAEYVLSTLDIFGTKAKQFFGMENPQVNIRKDLRELFDDLGVNPDLMMHGTGRYLGAGPLKLLEMFGAPVPNLDITGSVSMGEPLPGFRVNDLKGDPSEMAGQLLLNGLGPIPNIALGMWNSVSSTDPDSWKNFEKALPVAMKNVSKATRFYTRGMETSRGGAEFLLYDGNNPYEMGEIVAQAMGFTSTRLAQKREMYGEQIQSSMYWASRRTLLLERYAYASKTKNKEARTKAIEDIRRFNASLTDPALVPYKISGPSMARSLKTKLRILRKRELGIPTTDRDRLIYSDIEKLYAPE